MTTIKAMAFAVAAVWLAVAGVGTAQAQETLTFRVQSGYPYKVQIAFFSQTRSYVWPGPGKAFSLDDSDLHEFPLSCRSGEEICYGAWVTGDGAQYWGVGAKNDQSCKKCCFVCGDGDMTPVLSLSD